MSSARKPKVLVRSGVICVGGAGASAAPCGEYEVEERAAGVTLSSADRAREFTLSIDAYCRMMAEGRISPMAG
ncbi:MAG: hypothetical protein HXY23_13530 [Parvularculaceae bacterium]|jgi:hypothetical protein|nr:hypothetical protein [Parvularculaceae bacterium]